MNVLWFTGVQLPAVTGAGLNRAGWQEGLRRALYRHYPDLKLSIASFGSEPYEPFQVENATYYNIMREQPFNNRWKRAVDNWRHRSYKIEDLSRILGIYDQVQPDLVFIFGTENPFGLVSQKFSVPSIISIQAVINGLVENLFCGLSTGQLIREFLSRETLIGQGIFHKRWTQRKQALSEVQIYQQNGYFCGRTEWDHDWMTRLNPSASYFHIDRVLRDPFYEVTWELDNSSQNRIFSLCGNAPFKGGITLVRALALLKRNGNDQLKLRLAGVDPDSSVGVYIAEILRNENMEDQVDLLGRLDSDQIITEMKAARIFILPSHMDNSPNSLAEAMVLGMPCIASNAGGISSMIQDGIDGLLYSHSDIQALVQRIILLTEDRDLAQNLGGKARENALVRHDPSTIAKQTFAMYQQVLSTEGVQ
jgi:glycosyltransferase involved in cell wall biosynthesis